MPKSDPGACDADALIEAVIDREGRYVNHPADRGGPTCWGVTEAVARAEGYAGAMPALPRATAASIYRRLYWQRPLFDQVALRAPRIAAELFDTGVNMGTAVATGFLQRALNALNRAGRDGAAARDGGAAGRTLHRARRAPPEPGGLSLWLARQSHRAGRRMKARHWAELS